MDNIYTRLRVLLHGRRRPCDCTAPGRRRRITRTGATRSARRVRNRSDLIVNCGAAGSIRLYPDLSGSIRAAPERSS